MSFPTIRNPIIRGFNPDPSICRVGEDFYIVTSTFEFFPGVPIYHSKDLVNWKLIGNCLRRPSQLPLHGASPSAGIWAPTIRHHNGVFYMITTRISVYEATRQQNVVPPSFYVTTKDIHGPWSEPIYVHQIGIDPSLFFDDDGKVYLTSQGHNDAVEQIGGIYQCEIDIHTGQSLTETRLIWSGMRPLHNKERPEGPHLYKRQGWYYLIIAEGGCGLEHMVTVARSRDSFGPFESYEKNPLLTQYHDKSNEIQRAGHADLVQAVDGS